MLDQGQGAGALTERDHPGSPLGGPADRLEPHLTLLGAGATFVGLAVYFAGNHAYLGSPRFPLWGLFLGLAVIALMGAAASWVTRPESGPRWAEGGRPAPRIHRRAPGRAERDLLRPEVTVAPGSGDGVPLLRAAGSLPTGHSPRAPAVEQDPDKDRLASSAADATLRELEAIERALRRSRTAANSDSRTRRQPY